MGTTFHGYHGFMAQGEMNRILCARPQLPTRCFGSLLKSELSPRRNSLDSKNSSRSFAPVFASRFCLLESVARLRKVKGCAGRLSRCRCCARSLINLFASGLRKRSVILRNTRRGQNRFFLRFTRQRRVIETKLTYRLIRNPL